MTFHLVVMYYYYHYHYQYHHRHHHATAATTTTTTSLMASFPGQPACVLVLLSDGRHTFTVRISGHGDSNAIGRVRFHSSF